MNKITKNKTALACFPQVQNFLEKIQSEAHSEQERHEQSSSEDISGPTETNDGRSSRWMEEESPALPDTEKDLSRGCRREKPNRQLESLEVPDFLLPDRPADNGGEHTTVTFNFDLRSVSKALVIVIRSI